MTDLAIATLVFLGWFIASGITAVIVGRFIKFGERDVPTVYDQERD